MGAKSSKIDTEVSEGETAFFAKRDTPVQVHLPLPSVSFRSAPPILIPPHLTEQFSPDLISHLSSTSSPTSSGPSPARQQTLDDHIKDRLHRELTRLKSEEASIKAEIEKALEEESLKKASEPGGARHSASLLEDLKKLEERSGKLKTEVRDAAPWTILAEDKKKLQECFLCVHFPTYHLTSWLRADPVPSPGVLRKN